jgi:hypothetical protein
MVIGLLQIWTMPRRGLSLTASLLILRLMLLGANNFARPARDLEGRS